MQKKTRFIVNHYLTESESGTNELLILEPDTNSIHADILFFHGHQVGMRMGAWETPKYLGPLLSRGYRIFVPSILGYGKTTGQPDYCGPNTLYRIEELIRNFIDAPVHVMGASRGGTLAALFAEHYPELTRSCTAIAGAYDFDSLLKQIVDEKLIQNILDETGGAVDSYRKRDPKTLWQKLKAPLHIVHGADDSQIPVTQAEEFAAFLHTKGLEPKLTIIEKVGHKLFSERFFEETIIPFLEVT